MMRAGEEARARFGLRDAGSMGELDDTGVLRGAQDDSNN